MINKIYHHSHFFNAGRGSDKQDGSTHHWVLLEKIKKGLLMPKGERLMLA